MTSASGVFRLIGGRPCLNLIATYGKRNAGGLERLPDNAALLDWLIAAGVLPVPVPVGDGQLDAVRDLREATNRLVRAVMAAQPFDVADIALLNQVAAGPALAPQLGAAPGRGAVTWSGHDPVDAAMATLARDAVDLLAGPHTGRIKECARPECSLLFYDDSQSSRRRWCSMDRCGNLMKIAGYRQRARH